MSRFSKLVTAIRRKAKREHRRVRDPQAIAAAIGRRKYGARRFELMAEAGRRRAERKRERK